MKNKSKLHIKVYYIRDLAFEYITHIATNDKSKKKLDLAMRVLVKAVEMEINGQSITKRCFQETVIDPAVKESQQSDHMPTEGVCFDEETIAAIKAHTDPSVYTVDQVRKH